MQSSPPQATIGRILIVLAAAVIVLGGMRASAPVLNPMMFAVVLSLLVSPLYGWLRRQRLPSWLSLIIMMVVLGFAFGALFYMLSASVTSLAGRLTFYVSQLDTRIDSIVASLSKLGLESIDVHQFANGSTMVRFLRGILGAIGGLVSNFSLILMTTLFFVAEGPYIMKRLLRATNNPQVAQLTTFGENVIHQFGLRAIVNGVTAILVAIALLILGIDSAILWSILTFFLSYVPYIGTIFAAIPPVLLGLAEFGLGRAILVIVLFTASNLFAENVLSPALLSRGLNISPTVVFVSFAFWTWLLGGTGAFLAMPLTFLLILIFNSFPETRWLVQVMTVHEDSEATDDATTPSSSSTV